MWNVQAGRAVHRIARGDDFLHWAAFAPNFHVVAVSGENSTVRCLDLRTGKEWCRLAGRDWRDSSRVNLLREPHCPNTKSNEILWLGGKCGFRRRHRCN